MTVQTKPSQKKTDKRLNLGKILHHAAILSAIAIVPPLAVRFIDLNTEAENRLEQARLLTAGLATEGVERAMDVVEDARTTIQILSQVPDIRESKDGSCQAILRQVMANRFWASGFYLAGNSGVVTCSTSAETIGVSIADRPYFQKALTTSAVVVGDYIFGKKTNVPLIAVATAIRSSNADSKRVLVATIDLSWFDKLARRIGNQHSNSVVYLIDGRNTVLAAFPQSLNSSVGKPLASTFSALIESNTQQTAFPGEGLDNERYIFSTKELPHTKAKFIVGIPEATLTASIHNDKVRSMTQIGLFGALTFLFIVLYVQFILIAPMQTVIKMARSIGSGKLDARIGDHLWISEIKDMSNAIDMMAENLEQRQARLTAAHEELRQLATTDPLTGLANRRLMDELLNEACERRFVSDESIAILMIDVDHFKLFNDLYGHDAGDKALRLVSAVLRDVAENARGTAARIGGEEFVLMLPETSLETARNTAEWAREAIAALAIPHEKSAFSHITVSIGIGTPGKAEVAAPKRLLKMADIALYDAKASGRNRVSTGVRVKVKKSEDAVPVSNIPNAA